jgi:tRNA-specific 2-thiouridylase
MKKNNQTVFVGMSGGVDSSLTAALLKKEGYKVVGVYMKNWTQDLPGFLCPWKEDFQDAKRVAVQLGIEFDVFDFESEYRKHVVQYMIDEYKAGRTPNPDIMCNQEVKFKLFLEAAIQRGANLIATGHYARINKGQLQVAKNIEKDQTYFLYRINKSALDRSIFPIGDFKDKATVRAQAEAFGLSTAQKKDSQGICFVGKVGIKDFLKQYVTTTPGPIVDNSGVILGEHEGAIFYTIGQRHGLDVGGGLPYYVTHKDMKANTVYVTTDLSDPSLWTNKVIIRSVHWINEPPTANKNYKVRLRYRGPLIDCQVQLENAQITLLLASEQRAIAAGQSAVIYDEEYVLGGGIISEALIP